MDAHGAFPDPLVQVFQGGGFSRTGRARFVKAACDVDESIERGAGQRRVNADFPRERTSARLKLIDFRIRIFNVLANPFNALCQFLP